MGNDKKNSERCPDLTQFVRSLQRIEGKPDCFATIPRECDPSYCQWHCYCLREIKKRREKMMSIKIQRIKNKSYKKDF